MTPNETIDPRELAARAKEVFLEALDRPAGEREQYIERHCASTPALATRVRALFAAHVALERAGVEEFTTGATIGPFRLEERLGEGGFGEVWRASQEAPVRRDVALKILKTGLDTREVVARFEAERQALARMQHPAIARVYDAGSTPRGRPWFAMELVDGQPITAYASVRSLSLGARIALLIEVAHAVQHAHQKGVIHRDLKPHNVLVQELEGRPLPKVIDFGIAKAIGEPLSDDALVTRAGALVGTPAYMSPEQLAGSPDVDTQSDVYALGVLLYELVAGVLPWPQGSEIAVHRAARERPVERPSARLVRDGRAREARSVRGELDWVVLRALEPLPERRYASAAELADELQRFLRGEGVLAGRPSLSYRAMRFARRHRVAVSLSIATTLVIVAAAIVSAVQASRARKAEVAARLELARYEEIARQFEGILAGLDPAVAQGRDQELLLELLENARSRIESREGSDEVVEATLRRTIGMAYFCLARYDESETELARALELREHARGPDHEETLQSLDEWGAQLMRRGRAAEALAPLQRAYDGRRKQLGPDHRDTLSSQAMLGIAYLRVGRPAEAEPLLRAVEEARIRELGPSAVESVRAMNNVANALSDLGRDEEARERWNRALELQLAARGETHPDTLAAMNNVALWELDHGHPEIAEPLLSRAWTVKRRILAPGHPSLITTVNNLASAREDLGRVAEAEALYKETLDSIGGAGSTPESLGLAFNYASMLARVHKSDEAEAALAEVAEQIRNAEGDHAPLALNADSMRAELLVEKNRAAEAEPLARATVEACDAALPERDIARGVFRVRYAEALRALGRDEEARAQLTRAIEVLNALGETRWKNRAQKRLDALAAQPSDSTR